MNWTHGATSAWIGLALTAAGLLVGTIIGRANLKRTLVSLLLTIPLTIFTAILWSAILWLAPVHFGDNVNALLGIPFFLLCGAVTGALLTGNRVTGAGHKRGTLLGSEPERPRPQRQDGLTLAGHRIRPQRRNQTLQNDRHHRHRQIHRHPRDF